MKKNAVLLISTLILLCIILAFKTSPEHRTYQHMTIITRNYDLDHVWISIDGKEYSNQKRLKRESQGEWDMNPVINLVHEYEAQGWELQSFTGNGEYYNFWLRREK